LDDEFDDFDDDNKLIKEYVDIDNKFRITKKRKLHMEKMLDEVMDGI